MHPRNVTTCAAFDHHRLIASGGLADVVRAAKQALDAGARGPVLIFDGHTSRQIEVDFRGSADDVLEHLQRNESAPGVVARGPGRPKLGVVPREVTLLPRHWDWLAQQPGGASAVLRRLVEHASRGNDPKQRSRLATESVDRFMLAMTGDFVGHEEASRAFYRGERERFATLIESWPLDVRDHLRQLALTAWHESSAS
jgi:uncharacterized protein